MSLFVALWPSEEVRDQLERAVHAARSAAPELRWTPPREWHLTLVFLGAAGERLPELSGAMERALAGRPALDLALDGWDTFPLGLPEPPPSPGEDGKRASSQGGGGEPRASRDDSPELRTSRGDGTGPRIPGGQDSERQPSRDGGPGYRTSRGGGGELRSSLGSGPERRASVLWAGVRGEGLHELADSLAEAARGAGVPVPSRPFVPHVTLARARPPRDVADTLRLLGPAPTAGWRADRIHLVESRPAGRDRYRTARTWGLPWGSESQRAPERGTS